MLLDWVVRVVLVGGSVMEGGTKVEGVGSKEVRRSEGEVDEEAVIRRLFCREALLVLVEERGLGRGELVSPW